MQYQKRGYIKTYDEKGMLVSKVPVGKVPVGSQEIVDVESDEEMGDE